MISNTLQITMLLAVTIYFILLIMLLKKKRLLLKYSFLWIISGLVMLLFTAFPDFLTSLSRLVGIYDPVNALFAILFFCGIILLVSLTAIVSAQNEKIKRLVQRQAILEEDLRTMKELKHELSSH